MKETITCPHGCGNKVYKQLSIEHVDDANGKKGDLCLVQWANKNVPIIPVGRRGYYGKRKVQPNKE